MNCSTEINRGETIVKNQKLDAQSDNRRYYPVKRYSKEKKIKEDSSCVSELLLSIALSTKFRPYTPYRSLRSKFHAVDEIRQ